MKKTRIAINGFGRIGRVTARFILGNPDLELVAINDLTDAKTLGHLFKYDSIHGKWKEEVKIAENAIIIGEKEIKVLSEKDPEKLPWKSLDIDVVIESTGFFRTEESANKHIISGAKKVIISAPAKAGNVKTIVFGVNDSILEGNETIVSNASCTTNCAAPMIQLIDQLCGIEHGFLTTIHSYTGDQRLHDSPHIDLRRARAAAVSIIPTTTGAAKAVTKILPHLEGKLIGNAIRVPVPDGSITELILTVKNIKTVEEINRVFKLASENQYKNIVSYNEDPIVSIDIVGDRNSCVFDSTLTAVLGNTIKISGWYDNESGYSSRLVDLILLLGK